MSIEAVTPKFGKEWVRANEELSRLPREFSIAEAAKILDRNQVYVQKVVLKRMRELELIERIPGTRKYRRTV